MSIIKRIRCWWRCHFSAWTKFDDGKFHHIAIEQCRGCVDKFFIDGERIAFPANIKMKYLPYIWRVVCTT